MPVALNRFLELLRKMFRAYPTLQVPTPETAEAWIEIIGDLDEQRVERGIALIMREVSMIYPSTNIAALIRAHATPTITVSTIHDALMRAHSLLTQCGGDPFGYLRRISPRLLEMAKNSSFFDREQSTTDVSIAANRIAKAYVEKRENAKKGVRDPDPVPSSRQLPPAAKFNPLQPMTESEQAAGKAACQKIIDMLRGSKKLETKRDPQQMRIDAIEGGS